jgi:hypothetical protein
VAVALRESAPLLTGRELKRALAEADYLRLLDTAEVEGELGRGRPGAAALRKAIERHDPTFGRTLSPLEDVFVDLCEERGLPRPHLRYSWTQVTDTPHKVEADLRRSLAKGPPSRAGPS